MNKVTIDQVLAWEPCENYDRSFIKQLFNGRESLNTQDILELAIPTEDKMWAFLRPEFLSEKSMRLFAANCAEHVLNYFEDKYPEDTRPREAIQAARDFAEGKIGIEELEVAREAAWAAARNSALAAVFLAS